MSASELIKGPLDGRYLYQAADEVLPLRMMTATQIRFAFKLNLLFAPELAVSARAVLSNPVLYGLLIGEPEGMRRLYENGVLRPVLRHPQLDMLDVADGLGLDNSVVHLNEPELRNHAREIDRVKPSFLVFHSNEAYYRDYYQNLLEFCQYLNKVGLVPGLRSRRLIKPGALESLVTWLEEQADVGSVGTSQVRRFIEGSVLDRRLCRTVQIFGDIVGHLTLAEGLVSNSEADFSAPQSAFPFVEQFYRNRSIRRSGQQIQPYSLVIRSAYLELPLNNVAELPIGDLIEIRNSSQFKSVRNLLSRFNALTTTAALEGSLLNALRECERFLWDFTMSDPKRKEVLQRWTRKKALSRLVFWYDEAANYAVVGLGLFTLLGLIPFSRDWSGLFSISEAARSTNVDDWGSGILLLERIFSRPLLSPLLRQNQAGQNACVPLDNRPVTGRFDPIQGGFVRG